jgi:urocanate hydratase
MKRNIKATTGYNLRCKGWKQEAILRMLENNLENAEIPEELIIYGGIGKAARNWQCFDKIVETLKNLNDDETMIIQSGKPVAVFKTWEKSPRVLMANSNIVPYWSNWKNFYELEKLGLIMYGQMTAGSWCYIGTQGIIQGTYETFSSLAKKHFNSNLKGKIVLTGGLGGMGGAQPLAVKMAGGVCIAIECNEKRIDKRIKIGYCDKKIKDFTKALTLAESAKKRKHPLAIGVLGNCADIFPKLLKDNFIPDIATDQTSAHDELNGYIPSEYFGNNLKEAFELREKNPDKYIKKSLESIKIHCKSLIEFYNKGSIVFDYGNNLRGQAFRAGLKNAFNYPGFVPEYIRPMLCIGRGPFRWIALSGDYTDIIKTDKAIIKMFPNDFILSNWINLAQKYVPFEGLPARVCWLGYGEREKFALKLNKMIKDKEIGPIAITRDHLDSGSVASPYRETENMKDKSDVIADWPLLNALLNCAAGADSVQIHNGGGVGIGFSIHAGMVVVCDGTVETDERIKRVFKTDPGMGVVRHADAGYDESINLVKKTDLLLPMMK